MPSMIDLEKMSGLPIALEKTRLVFRNGLEEVEPATRTIEQMRPFLLDGNANFRKPIVYYMYRNVGLKKDREIFMENNLRYDLTVMENGKIGQEFVKTIGHYHPLKPGTKSRYPEIYEIIYGHALLIMQKIEEDESKIAEVCIVTATAGEKVVMLPGCGHVTVNISNGPLVMGNIVSNQFNSVYAPYKEKRGASYYILERNGRPEPYPNKLYGAILDPQILKPKQSFLNVSKGTPLYVTVSEDLEKFKWLNFPEEFLQELTTEKLFNDTSLLLDRELGLNV
jgi:glucose-6-phosphate isomerase